MCARVGCNPLTDEIDRTIELRALVSAASSSQKGGMKGERFGMGRVALRVENAIEGTRFFCYAE